MAGAAGTALFRSMARKMAQHRVIAARGLHSSGVGRSSPPNPSRLSTSSGSSATSNEHLAARDSEFMIKDQIIATTNTCLAVLVFGTGLFYTFVKPRLNKLEHRADTLSTEVFNLRQEIIKLKTAKDDQAQSMETSGPKSTS